MAMIKEKKKVWINVALSMASAFAMIGMFYYSIFLWMATISAIAGMVLMFTFRDAVSVFKGGKNNDTKSKR